ncbi:DUF1990 domain-containing protein [Kitasatospora cinereorecta]|uniref:DUF1990 domain-containing protein n=1 Tax=Kitasatospora cinereorecta TaxID=285560 RepID=A0ABW0VLL0_9ACTN
MTGFTYAEVGRTRAPEPLPDGYNHLRHRTLIGRGRSAFRAAGDAVLTFRMHRAVGVGIRSDAERALPGVRVDVALGAGPVRIVAPCQVVWSVDEPNRIGFAYGTLRGHPECGEESFVVELSDVGDVWLTVTAFSRPAHWSTRLGGPLVPIFQHAYARRCGRVLRRLVRTTGPRSA